MVVPVWLASHLQLSVPGAASPLLCCDSRLVHQTAGPPRASADPSAADAGSVGKSQNLTLSEDEDPHMQQKEWCISYSRAVKTNPLTLLQLAVSSTSEGAC